MDFKPRVYQTPAAAFLMHNQSSFLMAKPGMGKTGTVLMLADHMMLAGSCLFPFLVLGPKEVIRSVWPAEIARWDRFRHLRYSAILGTADQRIAALRKPADIYGINYENIPWLVELLDERGVEWPFKTLIPDESTKLKNFRLRGGGIRSTALSTIARKTQRRHLLSGTPSPNGLKDLWGQMWFVDFGQRLGRTYTAFLNRWFIQDAYTREIVPRPNAEREIYEAIADVTMALRPEDYFNIQDPVHLPFRVDLPQEARAQYDVMERKAFLEIGDSQTDALNALSLSGKLLQMAAGILYDNDGVTQIIHDAKIEALRSIIEECGGEPIMLVYWHKAVLQSLKEAFPEMVVYRGKAEEDSWNAGKVSLLAVQPASAGHGLNLQHGGRIMVFLEHNWNLELRLQVIERIGPTRQHQSGYQRAVLIYDIVANNTLDEEVLERNTGKLSVQEALMAARAHRG